MVCNARQVGRWMDCASRGRCSTTCSGLGLGLGVGVGLGLTLTLTLTLTSTTCSGRVTTRIRRSSPTEKSSTDCTKTQPPRT